MTISDIPTALDYSQGLLDTEEKRFVSRIREHGWTGTYVFCDEGSGKPDFYYTAGFWLLGFPELIIFSLEQEPAHRLAWQVYELVKAGEPPEFRAPVPQMFGSTCAIFTPFKGSSRKEHLTWTDWFYQRQPFEAVKVMWAEMVTDISMDDLL